MKSKIDIVEEYLKKGKYIDDAKAVKLCQSYRLSGIIYELRHTRELDVRDRWRENKHTGTRYKEYYLHNAQ